MATTSPSSQPTLLLGRPVCLWIKTIVWCAVCSILIVIGVLFGDDGDCELSPQLPTFLVATAALHMVILLLQFVFLTDFPVNRQELQANNDAEPKAHPTKMIVSLLGMGGVVLYILGTIWTYPKANDFFEDGASCNPTIFISSFVLVTLFYLAMVASCGFICLAPCIMPMMVRRMEEKSAKVASETVAYNV